MKKRTRLILLSLTSLCCALLISGCWDRREINDFAFVLASAMDKEGDNVRINLLIPLPGNLGSTAGGGGSSGGKQTFVIKSESGRDIREALAKMQKRIPRKLFIGHRRIILIGEELARSGVEKMMDGVTRLPENRLTVFIAVTKGKAIDVLNADTRIERFSAEEIREVLQSDASIRVTLKDVIGKILTIGTDAYLPYLQVTKTTTPRQKSDDIDVAGYALTHNGKMTAVAKGEFSNGIRLLSGKFKPYNITLNGKMGKPATFTITSSKLRIRPMIVSGKPNFNIIIRSKASLEEDLDLKRNYEDPAERSAVEKLVEKNIREDVIKALTLMQKSNSDVIGFGQYANRAYPGMWKKNWKSKWEDLFPQCSFNVQVDANLYRIGMNKENMSEREK